MIPNLIVKLLFLVFGTLRPGYQTYLQFTKEGVNGCTGWVKYWIVYAVLIAFWSMTDVLFFWLPLYEELKLGFMIWLFLAPPSGSAALFDHIIYPLMVRNEKTLEIVMNEDKEQMYVELRNFIREVCAWMERSILPPVINTIRVQLYPVLISEVCSVLLKSEDYEINMTAEVVDTETKIEEHFFEEWEDALNTQLPEEDNDEATHLENNPFLNDGASINEDVNCKIDNGKNNFMPISGKWDICQLIQLVQSNKGIKDVKDEAIYEKIGQSTMC